MLFRDRPLACLLIGATFCGNLVLWYEGQDSSLAFFLFNYGLPAQAGAVALWAALHHGPRLTRAAWLTVAFVLLQALTWSLVDSRDVGESLALTYLQFILIVLLANLLRASGITLPTREQTDPDARPWQVSLIELFGWSIIVSVWAFVARHATWSIVADGWWCVWLATSVLAPIATATACLQPAKPAVKLLSLLSLFASLPLGVLFLRTFDQGPLLGWLAALAGTQITYLLLWWAVLKMDQATAERIAELPEDGKQLTLFEPTAEKRASV